MKRRHVVLVGIMCLSLLAACGKQGEENKGSMETQDTEEAQETQDMEETQDTEDTQDTGTDLIQKLEAANSEEALMQKNEKVAFTAAYSFADGTVASQYNYADSQRAVVENDYCIVIDEQGDVYGFNNEEKTTFHALFADGAYEPYRESYQLSMTIFKADDREKVVDWEEKDGIIELSTSIKDKSFVDEMTAGYLYEDGAVESLIYEYEIDAKSYEITKSYLYAVLPDGDKVEMHRSERVADPETYVVEEQIHSAVFEGDMRKVTLTENPGTKQEKIYTQTVSKGNEIQVNLSPGHSGELYLDAACTVPYEGGADKNEDLDLYYIR